MPKSNRQNKKVYLDYASGAYPNPGSLHEEGVKAQRRIEESRKTVADILSARPEEIIFTSGGTESNNLAIQGLVLQYASEMKNVPHLVTTNIEHPSVLETFKMLESRGVAEVSIVPVGADGRVDPKKIKEEIRDNTILVSVMYANNEVGTIQPIKETAREIKHRGVKKVLFHTDAVQGVNYLDLNVDKLGVDMLTLSGTKMQGVGAGVGILYKKKGIKISPLLGGGGQEHGLRPGTENPELIENFARSLFALQKKKDSETKRLSALRDFFIKEMRKIDSGLIINGSMENRLPNNVNITFPKIPSDIIVLELSARGVYVSEKSACKSGDEKNSHVILAIREASGSNDDATSIRFSFGHNTKKDDLIYTAKAIEQILFKLKKWYH